MKPRITKIAKQKLSSDLFDGLDVSREITIALYGIKGSLTKEFLVSGFNQIKEYFPHVRFIGVGLTDIPPTKQLDLPWHGEAYLSVESLEARYNEQALTIDGVIAAVPPNVHLEIAKKWVDRGVPVWIEKPLVLLPQLEEIKRLIYKNKNKVFPVDFFLNSTPVGYLLEHTKLLQSVGKLRRIDGRLIENWPLELGREWLMNPEISGGGLGMDILVHPIALIDRFLNAYGKATRIKILDVVKGQYVDAHVMQTFGVEETYMYIRGKVDDIDVIIDGGKSTNEHFYGITLTGDMGRISVCTGSAKVDPYIHVQTTRENHVYQFPGEGIGYSGTFIDFLFLLYGSGKSCFIDLAERQRIGLHSIAYMKEAYSKSVECVLYKLGEEHPPVPVKPIGEIFRP